MSILKIKNEKGEWQGVTSVKGDKGEQGISPDITVAKNDRKTYQLEIDTKYRKFTTPNLKAPESATVGNTDGELGMIDNWYDLEGHRVTPYLSELPRLPRLSGEFPTRYEFDHDVVMYTLDGKPNDQGIISVEDYTRHEGSVITVEPNGDDYLEDYIIYNARPKYEWDTWEEKQLMNKTLGFPNAAANFNKVTGTYANGGQIYHAGDWNWVNMMMVATKDTGPAVCDEDLHYYSKKSDLSEDSVGIKGWAEDDPGIAMPLSDVYDVDNDWAEKDGWQGTHLGQLIYNSPQMKTGHWYITEGFVDGNCCGTFAQWGISQIARNYIRREKANREAHPDEMGMTIFNEGVIGMYDDPWGKNVLKEADVHRGIFVALDPNKNYTIETLNGDVGIYAPYNNIHLINGDTSGLNYGKHIAKRKTICKQAHLETITVYRREESQIVGTTGPTETGKVPVGNDKVLNTTVSYYVNENPDIYGLAEVPCVFNTPQKVLKKGQSMSFNISPYFYEYVGYAPQAMWGVYLFCWNEEDYAGIKIVEGIEPYSQINSERLATGATKFNMKVYFGAANSNQLSDVNLPRYEYNVKLVDTTEDNGYVRYLTNELKKSYDLDEFAMYGHEHRLEDIADLQELKDTVPKMKLSTTTLVDGVSKLEPNTFYFVYD